MSSTVQGGRDADRFTIPDQRNKTLRNDQARGVEPMAASQFELDGVMGSAFVVGQLVRIRETGRICEVVRTLPVVEDGMLLYVIRSEHGAELIARHHDLARA